MEYAPRKIKYSGEFELCASFKVMRDWLDTNNHVNNGRFVAMALEYLPEGFQAGQIRVEYKHSAFHRDELRVKRQISDGKVIIIIENKEETVCVIIEFTE